MIMGRYRPPQEKGSPYITRTGYENLQRELDELWQRRAEVTRALAAAAAEGDRSENAEYIYRKKELREIDRRIRYLQVRMPTLKVVNELPQQLNQVYFGAWVHLEDEKGETIAYRIVGPDEFNPEKRYISMDSPLARALMKKMAGDEIEVHTPEGKRKYIIAEIRYPSPQY